MDDSPDLRMLLRSLLSASGGFDVLGEAVDGVEGIAACLEHQPDVVLLDIAMPRMDGISAVPEIRRVAPKAIIVMFSGFEARRLADAALAAGAVAFLEKGLPPAEIVSKLRQIVATQS